MPDVPRAVTDPVLRARLSEIQARLRERLPAVDPHHRLFGRPVTFHVIGGETIEIVYRDVPSIAETEVLGIKRLIGESCHCHVTPQTAETLTVRFVIPLKTA